MPRYKRTRDDAELDVLVEPVVPPENKEMLMLLRNMWEFASLMQYIFLFGHAMKIDDDFDIEDLEAECLKPTPSDKLAHIGLQLLKYVSSHRGLTPEIFEEYTRRQYAAKAPQRNPFGDEEEPVKFNDLDIYTRIKVLQQLSTWTLGNAERFRGMMPQDEDHLNWRMEPLGWDKDDRSYYVLDDNRLYRRADEPPPPPSPKPKATSKMKSKSSKSSRSRATRASKRRKIEDSEDEELEQELEPEQTAIDDTIMTNGDQIQQDEEAGYGFTSKTWELVAITLEEYQDFMASIFRSRDPNEKQLRSSIEEDVLPIIEKRAEAVRQKQMKKMRELENLQKMSTAKRSSRLAGKAEKEKQEREEREMEEKRQTDLRMAREEQEKQRRIEEGHESRRLTREQRVRERETKRILHEEELARLEEETGRAESPGVDGDTVDAKRISERQRKTQREQHKKELEKLAEDEGNWYFDCAVCGKHGENMDDGTHSIACDRCNVWQHSKCHNFSPKQAESEGFSFICATCKRKEEDAKKPKIPPLKLTSRTSESPESHKSTSRPSTANVQQQYKNQLPDHVTRQLDTLQNDRQPQPSPGPFGQLTNGPSLSPHGQAQGPPGYRYPSVSNFAPHPPQQAWNGNPYAPTPAGYAPSPSPESNGYSVLHQQQHQYAHQNAVVSAGGHPAYRQHYGSPNAYGPQTPAGMYPVAQQPQEQQNHHTQQEQQQYSQHRPPTQQQQKPPTVPLMNGFQSPVKAECKTPSSSPPSQRTHAPGTPQGYSRLPSQQQVQQLHQSPRTNLPPPAEMRPAQSPTKSSPLPGRQQPLQSTHQRPSPVARDASHTPQHTQYPPANGRHPGEAIDESNQLHTPQMRRLDGTGSTSTANHVAADGMSGPWPESSKEIPQKHDQSPAPPSSSQTIGEKKIFPPRTPLVPSPGQQAAGAASVPVKRIPGPNPEGNGHVSWQAAPPE